MKRTTLKPEIRSFVSVLRSPVTQPFDRQNEDREFYEEWTKLRNTPLVFLKWVFFFCLIDSRLILAASYSRVSVEHYTGSLQLSSSLLLAPSLRPHSNLLLRILLLWPDTRGERWSLPMHWGTFSAQTRTEKDSCRWLTCHATDSQNVYDISSAPLSSCRWSRKEKLREGT